MNIRKEQAIDMHMQKICLYIAYIDCLSRVINEFIENGASNIESDDLPNLSEMLTKLCTRLKKIIYKMNTDWEFMK